jgi:hypothetical protein
MESRPRLPPRLPRLTHSLRFVFSRERLTVAMFLLSIMIKNRTTVRLTPIRPTLGSADFSTRLQCPTRTSNFHALHSRDLPSRVAADDVNCNIRRHLRHPPRDAFLMCLFIRRWHRKRRPGEPEGEAAPDPTAFNQQAFVSEKRNRAGIQYSHGCI